MDEEQKPGKKRMLRSGKGYLNPRVVRALTFYVITICIVLSVIACILAIWDYADKDVFWRMVSTFAVIASGSALFALINNIFGVGD
jgi:hypothetical protein